MQLPCDLQDCWKLESNRFFLLLSSSSVQKVPYFGILISFSMLICLEFETFIESLLRYSPLFKISLKIIPIISNSTV